MIFRLLVMIAAPNITGYGLANEDSSPARPVILSAWRRSRQSPCRFWD
jgi:hypothetical protein